MPATTRAVVVATPEPLGLQMAGPAVRALRMAEALDDAGHRVTLVSTATDHPRMDHPRLPVLGAADAPRDAAVYLVTGRSLLDQPWLLDSPAVVGVDWYDPFHLEALHRGGADRLRRWDLARGAWLTLDQQMARGDAFFCANERQRLYWLGLLTERLAPPVHDADPEMRRLIEVAAFGVDVEPPQPAPSPLRAIDGIGADDPLGVWAGGLHDWLDPVTVVRASALVAEARPDFRMVFMGGVHPNADLDPSGALALARAEAERTGTLDRNVFFHEHWIPFDERGAVLLDAAVGVCAHGRHLEAELSHRTRFLDHLWAGLPTVSSAGDPLSAQLVTEGAALVARPGDHDAMAELVLQVVTDDERRAAMCGAASEAAERRRWPITLAPLVHWVDTAEPAPDRLDPLRAADLRTRARRATPSAGATRYLDRARVHWRNEGATGLARRVGTEARDVLRRSR